MSGHTPGPWEVEWDEFAVYSTAGRHIAAITEAFDLPCTEEPDMTETQEESQANARLIAAAPDLLEACKAAVQLFAHGLGAMTTDPGLAERNMRKAITIKERLHAAIEKAEGVK